MDNKTFVTHSLTEVVAAFAEFFIILQTSDVLTIFFFDAAVNL